MQERIEFGNGEVTLRFSGVNGALEGLVYGGAFVQVPGKLWRVETEGKNLEIGDMETFSWQRYESTLKLVWKNTAGQVIVTVEAGEGEKLRWNMQVQLHGGSVGKVHFPILEGLRFETENNLIVTWQNGCMLQNPVENFLRKGLQVPFWMGRGEFSYENEYPAGLSYQYTAFYAEAEFGYYFATEDPDAYLKTYRYGYNPALEAMDFSLIHYPENMGRTESWCMPYDFVMVLFHGDWQTATRLYRTWAIRQKWCKAPLTEKYLPEKVKKTELWRVNHTDDALGVRTREYFDTSLLLRDTLECNLGLHWYGWNLNTEHDWDTPEYFTEEMKASPWPEELRRWNKRFSDEGIVKIPYTNARLWERTTESWEVENGFAAAVKDEQGRLNHEPWTPQQHLTTVCPACALWQEKVARMCREYVLEEGFDGAYLDQVASFNAVPCFDETHPHPRGGGSWWNDGYHRMLSGVRKVLGKEGIMTTESCCETYVDVFDLFLILDTNFRHNAFAALTEGNVQQLPLFSMIYGDYALSYGSICRFSDELAQYECNYIRNILWGILPSMEAGTAEELARSEEYLRILKRGVDFYKAHREVLFYGRPVEIPRYQCSGSWEISWVAKDEEGREHPYEERNSAVSIVIWETSGGERYLFAYNFSPETQTVTVEGREYTVEGKHFFSSEYYGGE